jgi:hypothetical protein
MNGSKSQQKLIAVILVVMLLTGCNLPAATPTLSPLPPQQGQQTSQAGTCNESDTSPIGVLRSNDHGATWTHLGHACIQDMDTVKVMPADMTPLVVDGRITLYFVDQSHLEQSVPQIVYRTTSVDGVNFDTPKPAYTQKPNMMDPFILRLGDGSFRLYTPVEGKILTAVSADSVSFTRDGNADIGRYFGMPGALLLPDNRVRFFTTDGPASIISLISNDGLNFTPESGVRIQSPPDYLYIADPEPIRLKDGSYLMLYQVQDKTHEGRPEWKAELHLATSTDGFTWITNPTIIEYGGTSCVVEAPDGTLYIYYG